MANDLNRCEFIGRLGKDPEVRYSPSGDAVANISIACGWKTKDKEGTEWVPVTFYGKRAEIVGKYLAKGSQVYVSGRYRTRKWQDKNGQDRYSTEIVADTMQMLGGRSEGWQGARPPQESKQESKQEPQGKSGGFDDFDDDIPF